MVSKIVWIVKELIDHETNLIPMGSFVKWDLFLSKTFVKDIPMFSPFGTVRDYNGDSVDAKS